jgi:pimeloyl-ACP methyl ester carboxylesterase
MSASLAGGRTVDIDGIRTRYHDLGSGEPVVLIHGSSPGNDGEFAWAPMAPALARQRLIVVDAPGYGDSDMLPVADTPGNVGLHLGKLLDEIGIGPLAVVGHSRGGRIAVEMVAAFPERVTRLAIVCSGSVNPQGHTADDGRWNRAATVIVGFGMRRSPGRGGDRCTTPPACRTSCSDPTTGSSWPPGSRSGCGG